MGLETYEIILILIAIIATIAIIYWALNRSAQEGQPGAQAPKEDNRAISSAEAVSDSATPTGGEESIASAAVVPRARDAARSRSGSARRTAKPAASSGRAAVPGAVPTSASSDEPSSKIRQDAAPPAAEPSPAPAPQPPPIPHAKPAEPPKEAAAPAEKPSASRRDDLTVIRGIGKSIEKKLNALGITTFEQMAAWTREDLDRVDAALAFPGRAQRENWVGQAKTLAQKK